VGADLERMAQALRDPALRSVLLDPQTGVAQRRALLAKVIASAHELSRNVITVVLERRRQAILPELHAAFMALARAAKGEAEGVVESARPLSKEQVRELETTFSRHVGRKTTLRTEVLPALLGGIRVRVGNTLYDGSVASALEDLERRLMEAQVP
jgi:F-type H+-transporting ATPase subunit delta